MPHYQSNLCCIPYFMVWDGWLSQDKKGKWTPWEPYICTTISSSPQATKKLSSCSIPGVESRMAKQDSLRTLNLVSKGEFKARGNATSLMGLGVGSLWVFKRNKAWLISSINVESKLMTERCWWCLKIMMNRMLSKSLITSEGSFSNSDASRTSPFLRSPRSGSAWSPAIWCPPPRTSATSCTNTNLTFSRHLSVELRPSKKFGLCLYFR